MITRPAIRDHWCGGDASDYPRGGAKALVLEISSVAAGQASLYTRVQSDWRFVDTHTSRCLPFVQWEMLFAAKARDIGLAQKDVPVQGLFHF